MLSSTNVDVSFSPWENIEGNGRLAALHGKASRERQYQSIQVQQVINKELIIRVYNDGCYCAQRILYKNKTKKKNLA